MLFEDAGELYAFVRIDRGEDAMPRYFFRFIDEGQVSEDSEGVICSNDDAARREAAVTLSEVACDVLSTNGLLHAFEIEVLDNLGVMLWRIHLNYSAEAGSG